MRKRLQRKLIKKLIYGASDEVILVLEVLIEIYDGDVDKIAQLLKEMR